jgi:hypothetical protein
VCFFLGSGNAHGPELVRSACNAHAYVKFQHRVAPSVCANWISREAGDVWADGMVFSEADEDWLRSNVCLVAVAPGETMIFGEAGEHEAGTEVGEFVVTSRGGPVVVCL